MRPLLSIFLLILLVAPGCKNEKDFPQIDKKSPPAAKDREPSASVAAAWFKAGGHYDGMKMTRFGNLRSMPRAEPGAPEPRDGPTADELPAFSFDGVPAQRLAELPAIKVPFGIMFKGTTDEGLKKLAGVRDVRYLALLNTGVTDAG